MCDNFVLCEEMVWSEKGQFLKKTRRELCFSQKKKKKSCVIYMFGTYIMYRR